MKRISISIVAVLVLGGFYFVLGGQGGCEPTKPENFTLMDQNGNNVSLYDYEGQVILLNISDMACFGCNLSAMDAEVLYQDFKDDGFAYLFLIGEDTAGNPPDQDDLIQWADTYGLTMLVLADPNWEASQPWLGEAEPGLHILDPALAIKFSKFGYNPDTADDLLRAEINKYLPG